jgi:hypothetical protein
MTRRPREGRLDAKPIRPQARRALDHDTNEPDGAGNPNEPSGAKELCGADGSAKRAKPAAKEDPNEPSRPQPSEPSHAGAPPPGRLQTNPVEQTNPAAAGFERARLPAAPNEPGDAAKRTQPRRSSTPGASKRIRWSKRSRREDPRRERTPQRRDSSEPGCLPRRTNPATQLPDETSRTRPNEPGRANDPSGVGIQTNPAVTAS